MNFLPVLLWSDLLIWLLVLAGFVFGALSWRSPPLRAAWRRVGRSRSGMAAATVLLAFVLLGLLDSLHYRPRMENPDAELPAAYAVDVLSALDALARPLRVRVEKTYSAPLATRAFAKETVERRDADGSVRSAREFPRLKYGGAHLGVAVAGDDRAGGVAVAAAAEGLGLGDKRLVVEVGEDGAVVGAEAHVGLGVGGQME